MGFPTTTLTRSVTQPLQRHRRSLQWVHYTRVHHKLDSVAGATGTSVFQLPGRHVLVPPWAAIFVYSVIMAFLILTGAGFVLSYNARREFRRRLAEQAEAQALATPPPVSANELKSFTRRSILLLNNPREPSTYSPPYRMSRAGLPLPTNLFETRSRNSVLIAEVVPDLSISTDDMYRLTRGSQRASFWPTRRSRSQSLQRTDVQFEMLTQQATTSTPEACEVIDNAVLVQGQDSSSLARAPIQHAPPSLVILSTPPPGPDPGLSPGLPDQIHVVQPELNEKEYVRVPNTPVRASFEDDAPESLDRSISMRNIPPSEVSEVSKWSPNESSLTSYSTPRPALPTKSPPDQPSLAGLLTVELQNDMPPPSTTRNSADPDLAMAFYAAYRRAPSPVVSAPNSLHFLAQLDSTGFTPLAPNLPADVLVSSPISTEPTVPLPWQKPTLRRTPSGKLPLIPERALRDPEELARSTSLARTLSKNRSRTPPTGRIPKRHAMLFRSHSAQGHIGNSSRNSSQNQHHEQLGLEPILEGRQGVRRSNSMNETERPHLALPPPVHKASNLLKPTHAQGLPSRPVRLEPVEETLPGLGPSARRPSPLGSSARRPPPRAPLSGTMSSGGVRNSSFVR